MVKLWDPEDSNILDAHLTEVEDVFEDCLSETSTHVEKEEDTATSEETGNFDKEAAPQEEKKDVSKVHGLFNSTFPHSTFPNSTFPNSTFPMASPRWSTSFLARRRSTTYVMSASRHSASN